MPPMLPVSVENAVSAVFHLPRGKRKMGKQYPNEIGVRFGCVSALVGMELEDEAMVCRLDHRVFGMEG